MHFDWASFLDSVGIPYRYGPDMNISRDHIGIPCPLCDDDGGFHFGIRLEDGMTRGCWRDKEHYVGPVKLLSHLANIPLPDAIKMWNTGAVPTDDAIDILLAELEADETPKKISFDEVFLPEEAKKFKREPTIASQRAWNYMADRGFDPFDLSHYYGVRWMGKHDFWGGRILLPIRWGNKLVGWTGRAYGPARIRYLSYPPGELLSHLLLVPRGATRGGELLLLVEGPLDAYKIDQLGRDRGIHAVALMGTKMQGGKIKHLSKIVDNYDRCVVMLDEGEDLRAVEIAAELSVLGVKAAPCLPGYPDPGEFDLGALDLLENLAR
jgi:hypothetical protein